MAIIKEKIEVNSQPKHIRCLNYKEVEGVYNDENALLEASRCLNCKHKPCVKGCPCNIEIPEFISFIKQKKYDEAFKTILKNSNLSSICSRVCPQEKQCEKVCTMGIKFEPVAIGRLEKYVNEKVCDFEFNVLEKNSFKVAVIGSGPSGISCATELLKLGYSVTIYEAFDFLGGILKYGIPEFVLPNKFVDDKIEILKKLGCNFITNCKIGKDITINELKNKYGFDAVYLACGADIANKMNIKGEDLNNVLSWRKYLLNVNLDDNYKSLNKDKIVAVIGGGNVAIDAARCAIRSGAKKVYIIYRRSINEMPAREVEIKHALDEDIEIKTLTNPIEIIGDENNCVKSLKLISMQLSIKDESGRASVVEVEGSEHYLEVDTVIMAIGSISDKNVFKDLNISLTKNNLAIVNEYMQTSIDYLFAGGDIVNGPFTVVQAMKDGINASKNIDLFLQGNLNP